MPHCGGCAGTLRVRNGRSIYERFQRKEVHDMNEKNTAQLVFNLLVLVGAIKASDRIVREMMGLGG